MADDNPYSVSSSSDPGRIVAKPRSVQIRRFDPVQLGKFLGVMYLVVSLVVLVPIMLVMSVFGLSTGGGARAAGAGLGMMIFLPLIYAVAGFLSGLIGGFFYNLIAGWIGGIRIDLADVA